MDTNITYGLTTKPSFDAHHCLVLGYFTDDALPTFGKPFESLQHKLSAQGDHLWYQDTHHTGLLIHCGDKAKADFSTLTTLMQTLSRALNQQKINAATVCIPQLSELTANQQLEHMIRELEACHHAPSPFKSEANKHPHTLESIQFFLDDATDEDIQTGVAIAKGMALTRTLANLPPNHGTPSRLAKEALVLAEQYPSIKTHVLEREDIEALGMELFLSVSKGSLEPPKLIEVHYNGKDDDTPPIVLVGKGVTFDSGGISIKPSRDMHEMKYDMIGAASVLGVMKTCATLNLPLNITGLLACSENMVGGEASKPGDILTSMLGKTVEITNTDAEGRLLLADTLTYAERFNPEFVLDIATLTGAVIVALGRWASAFMTEDKDLATQLEQAGERSADPVWRLPLNNAYQSALDSPVADMVNSSASGEAGSVTAACFLSHFTKKFRWAHVDIAGTAWNPGKYHDATGRPVPLLMRLLRDIAHAC
jgi:leucyl aminopeptidase